MFANSQVLVLKYLDGIMHINMTPKATQKVYKEVVETLVLGVIMAQQFSLHVGLKKFGNETKISLPIHFPCHWDLPHNQSLTCYQF